MGRKTIAFWSCNGGDESTLAYALAEQLSLKGKTLIAELPCLGIPRLGFAAEVMNRSKNVDAALVQYEQKGRLLWDMVHQVKSRLAVLPASVFVTPDLPVAAKVEMHTLMGFAAGLQEMAWRNQCEYLVFDCQGQITSPMTFFALKAADDIVIPLQKPTDTVYAMASVRRLICIYQHKWEEFLLATAAEEKEIRKIISSQGEMAKESSVRLCARDAKEIAKQLQRVWALQKEEAMPATPFEDISLVDSRREAPVVHGAAEGLHREEKEKRKHTLTLWPIPGGEKPREEKTGVQHAWSVLLNEEASAYTRESYRHLSAAPDLTVSL